MMASRPLARRCFTLVVLGMAALWLAACGATAPTPAPEPTALAPAQTDARLQISGQLVPRRHLQLAAPFAGQVTEVLVAEGDQVAEGDLLLRLGDPVPLNAQLAAADLEALLAHQAIEDLERQADLERAQLQRALAEARQDLDLREDLLASLVRGPSTATLEQVRANLLLAERSLEQVRSQREKIEQRYANKASIWWRFLERRQFEDVLFSLDQAETYALRRYEDLTWRLEEFQAPTNPVELALAEAEVEVARTRIARLERQLQARQEGADLDLLAAAQARLQAAEAHQSAIQANLEALEIRAPQAGKIVVLEVQAGEWVAASQSLMVLADLSGWVVETDELTEQDVVGVSPGQSVQVIPEPLPEVQLPGSITAVKQLATVQRGDVIYITRIQLEGSDPRLRWGMTVTIEFGE